jgi:malate dehydrogenase (oxaloacetate-decarboxylating)
MDYNQKSLALHKKNHGKIEIKLKMPLKSRQDFSLAYTPGVGAVSAAIGRKKKLSWELTNRANQVAIVTDGTAVLGLGNLGPEAAMPVMEGKAALFKELAGVDAIPLCIATTDVSQIVDFCKWIAPSFAGISLEDIAAPRCFEILHRLEKELPIPVFHDDQDGTAIVVLAALMNAGRVTGKNLKKARIVISGAGAAGMATARLLLAQGINNIILVDSRGILVEGREDLSGMKREFAGKTNFGKVSGGLKEAVLNSDIFIGVSKAGILSQDMIRSMNPDPIIFAMANPVPEIMPDQAIAAGAGLVGTGRSDFPNQINNVLVFPGIFRGLLDSGKKEVTTRMKTAISLAIADLVKPTKDKILPDITDKKVIKAVVKAVKRIS